MLLSLGQKEAEKVGVRYWKVRPHTNNLETPSIQSDLESSSPDSAQELPHIFVGNSLILPLFTSLLI